jgi:predicted ArsR family transcriptional regulator
MARNQRAEFVSLEHGRMRDTIHERIADLLALLRKQPRTVIELHTLTDLSLHTIRRWLKALEAEGLLRRVISTQNMCGRAPDFWEWVN